MKIEKDEEEEKWRKRNGLTTIIVARRVRTPAHLILAPSSHVQVRAVRAYLIARARCSSGVGTYSDQWFPGSETAPATLEMPRQAVETRMLPPSLHTFSPSLPPQRTMAFARKRHTYTYICIFFIHSCEDGSSIRYGLIGFYPYISYHIYDDFPFFFCLDLL